MPGGAAHGLARAEPGSGAPNKIARFSRETADSPQESKSRVHFGLLWGLFLAGGWVKSSAGINVRGEVCGEGRGAGLRPGRGLMGTALGAVPGAGRGNTL